MGDSTFHDVGVTHLQKELENEIKFEKESNDSLALQMKSSQDANVELVSVLQELEETISKHKVEMAGDVHLIREIKALKVKLEELEIDCNELTDENLELLLKIKETKNDLDGGVPMSEQKSEMVFLEEKLQKKILREIQSKHKSYIQELESHKIELETEVTDVVKELAQKRTEIQTLETTMQSKEEEIVELRLNQIKKSSQDLGTDESKLEEHCAQLEGKLKESNKKVEDLDENLTLVIKYFASKEERLTLKLDEIHDISKKVEAK
ncbi:hypothetical protein V6N13_041544 [Hibiscus sabdariffa]